MRRPRLLAALAATTVLAAGAQGCALSPWDPETLPTFEKFESRITAGAGTTAGYHSELDGRARLDGPVPDPDRRWQRGRLHGPDRAGESGRHRGPQRGRPLGRGDDPLTGANGADIAVGNPTAFDPGYLGVEQHTENDELTIRVIAPRLTGTPQGQARFSFKLDVASPPAR